MDVQPRQKLSTTARWRRAIAPVGRWLTLLCLGICLTGCIQSEIGVDYQGQHHGEITQQIHLDQSLTRFGAAATQTWLAQIEQRTKLLGGRFQHPSADEVVVTIPFHNGAELEAKFNQFFQPSSPSAAAEPSIELPDVPSHFRLQERNFLLLLRNRVEYEVDLRSLTLLAANGNPIVTPNSLLTAQFRLTTPWGARRLEDTDSHPPSENPLIWQLHPGEVNRLNAVFWVPSPLGIGTLVIILLVVGGMVLQTWLFPAYPVDPSD